MKKELKEITKNLLLAGNLDQINQNKDEILKLLKKLKDQSISLSFKKIIEIEYNNLIEKMENDIDANIEQERLKIICLLTSINLLLTP